MSFEVVPRSGGGPPSLRLAELKVPQGKPYQIPTQFGLLMRSLSSCSTFFFSRSFRPPFSFRSNSKQSTPCRRTAAARCPEPLKTSTKKGLLGASQLCNADRVSPVWCLLLLDLCCAADPWFVPMVGMSSLSTSSGVDPSRKRSGHNDRRSFASWLEGGIVDGFADCRPRTDQVWRSGQQVGFIANSGFGATIVEPGGANPGGWSHG